MRHDRGQHLVGVEAGADRLADLGEGLELLHLAPQLGRAVLERGDELDVPQGQRRLLGEGGEQLARAVVEGVDLVAPHRQDADHLVLDEHRRSHDGPAAAELLQGELRVVGVGEDVLDLLGGAVHADASDEGARGRAGRGSGRRSRGTPWSARSTTGGGTRRPPAGGSARHPRAAAAARCGRPPRTPAPGPTRPLVRTLRMSLVARNCSWTSASRASSSARSLLAESSPTSSNPPMRVPHRAVSPSGPHPSVLLATASHHGNVTRSRATTPPDRLARCPTLRRAPDP